LGGENGRSHHFQVRCLAGTISEEASCKGRPGELSSGGLAALECVREQRRPGRKGEAIILKISKAIFSPEILPRGKETSVEVWGWMKGPTDPRVPRHGLYSGGPVLKEIERSAT